jgi:glycopeptide antibiotics resistance protein
MELPWWLDPSSPSRAGIISIDPLSLSSFLLLLIPLFFLHRRGRSAGYLLCFYVFSLYMWSVLSHTIVEFHVGTSEAKWIKQRSWSNEIRLIPALLAGHEFDFTSVQVWGNFVMGIPFGVGLPFLLARFTHRRVVRGGLGFATGIEVAQLLLGLMIYQAPYRVIDIDDVWLVFAGTLVGYGALWGAARVYRRIGWARGAQVPVWSHLHGVLLRVAAGGEPAAEDGPRDLETAGP